MRERERERERNTVSMPMMEEEAHTRGLQDKIDKQRLLQVNLKTRNSGIFIS